MGQKTLTVSGLTASSKVYDGTTAATVSGAPALVGVVTSPTPADVVTLSGTAAGTFANKHVGTGKAVTVSGLTLSGADSASYVLATPMLTANITPRAITVTATSDSKTYDATTASAAVPTITAGSLAGSDSATWTQTFNTKAAGTNRTLTPAGSVSDGNSGNNYAVTFASVSTGTIVQKALSVSGLTANDKGYDGNTTATINTGSASLVGVVVGDSVTLNTGSASGTFATKTVGTSKTVTIGGLTLAGDDAANYTLTQPSTTADITAKALTVSGLTADNKVYDGNTTATINTGSASLVGVVVGDFVTLNTGSASGTFATKTVGTSKTVTVGGLTLSGAGSANYTLTQPSTTADITAKALTVSGLTADNKVYDGNTTATINTGSAALVGVVVGDAVSIDASGATGTFADKNVGTGKTVTVSGIALVGADAGNYTLSSPTGLTGNITPKALTISGLTANGKVYDGSTTATLNTGGASLVGVVVGDSVSIDTSGATGAFADKNVGNGKAVTVSGIALVGADAGNYTLTQQPSTTADITPKTLAPRVTVANRSYDGTTAAAITARSLTPDPIAGDVVTLEGGTATFADSGVGTGKTVTVTGLRLGGTDAANYMLSSTSTTATADITMSAPAVDSVSPSDLGRSGSHLSVTVNGSGYVEGVMVSFSGAAIAVNSVVVQGTTSLILDVSVAADAPAGPYDLTVTNVDGGTVTLRNAVTVAATPATTPPPTDSTTPEDTAPATDTPPTGAAAPTPARASFTCRLPAPGGATLCATVGTPTPAAVVADLAAAGCNAHTIALLPGATGRWRFYIAGAPAVVNAAFPALIVEVAFFVRCR